MKRLLRPMLLRARYALPGVLGRMLPAPHAVSVLKEHARLHRRKISTTLGYFHNEVEGPEAVAAANMAALALMQSRLGDVYLSIKVPALGFDARLVRDVAAAAAAAGTSVMLDAHAPSQADRTLDLAEALEADFPGTGCVLPARWHRSTADAARFRDLSAPLRLVKGEWADAEIRPEDISASYFNLVLQLAGRAAPVAVASHDPILVERSLMVLLAAGTPCTLEQLRGMPHQKTTAIAHRLGVPVRIYLPFGPGWWPYALNKALAQPDLISETLREIFMNARYKNLTGLPAHDPIVLKNSGLQ